MKKLLPLSALQEVKNSDRRITMFLEISRNNFEAYGFEIVDSFESNNLPIGVIIDKSNGIQEFHLLIERNLILARISYKVDKDLLVTISLLKFNYLFKAWDPSFSCWRESFLELDKIIEMINSIII